MGQPVHTTSLGHHIFSIVTPDFLVEWATLEEKLQIDIKTQNDFVQN